MVRVLASGVSVRAFALALVLGGVIGATAPSASGSEPSQAAAVNSAKEANERGAIDFEKQIAPLFSKLCGDCHNQPELKERKQFAFATAAEAKARLETDRKLFETMAGHLKFKRMPPAEEAQPSDAERETLLGWLNELLAVDCSGPHEPGRVVMRRLNRVEYANTIRDLLYLDAFPLAEDFPPDDSGYGFDNNGDVLKLSPLLLEKYLAAAEEALLLAEKSDRASAKLRAPVGEMKENFYNRQKYPRLMVEAFLPRAFRRPVPAEEVDRYMNLVRLSLAQDGESSERAARLAMRAALLSPHFLFRVEGTPNEGEGILPLNEFQLASRLSYFLWSTMPDQELFDLAGKGELRANLPAQVQRMLKDAKAKALSENFAMQWLGLRSLESVNPDPALFPDFNANLRKAMLKETLSFFEAVVSEDRSILEMLDADYTFVNESLAALYGMEGVEGNEFRRVAVDAKQRGGLLTHASVLTVTSRPNRTAPVLRGKWILENILNAPSPPPPPDVADLEEAAGDDAMLSNRRLLEIHRADASCAVCHNSLDPLGLAFENYDAIGRWRDTEAGAPIDASGELPDGRRFDGPRELRSLLMSRSEDFRRCLAEKLLTYGLGRGIEYTDNCAIDKICVQTAEQHDRFSSLILTIVSSDPFQNRRGTGGAPP